MKSLPLTLIIGLSVIALQGCRWVDDFRDRQQPQALEQPLRPTLNPESIDYAGDPIKDEMQQERDVKLPAIDAVSEIPEVPEYPAGVGFD